MTDKERERLHAAAQRYVREQAPTPPVAVLERVARIVLQARTPTRRQTQSTNHQHPTSTQPSVMQAAAERWRKGAA